MRSQEDMHRAFRALLEAMARPGQWMPTPAEDAAGAVELLRQAVWEADPRVTLTEQTGAVSALAGADAGTEEEPELSSTVVVIARGGAHTRVSIDGPGVREPFTADVPVAKEALARRDSLCANFPRGVDMVFVDPRGRVLGLPRTTVVREVG